MNPSSGSRLLPPLLLLASLAAACTRAPAPAAAPGAAPIPLAAAVPVEPTTAEGCRACQGMWGEHGLTPGARCFCHTHDAGRRCRDGGECEGQCVGDNRDYDITDPGPPRIGYFLGRCSEYRATFGCHHFIEAGARRAGPINLEEALPELCVD